MSESAEHVVYKDDIEGNHLQHAVTSSYALPVEGCQDCKIKLEEPPLSCCSAHEHTAHWVKKEASYHNSPFGCVGMHQLDNTRRQFAVKTETNPTTCSALSAEQMVPNSPHMLQRIGWAGEENRLVPELSLQKIDGQFVRVDSQMCSGAYRQELFVHPNNMAQYQDRSWVPNDFNNLHNNLSTFSSQLPPIVKDDPEVFNVQNRSNVWSSSNIGVIETATRQEMWSKDLPLLIDNQNHGATDQIVGSSPYNETNCVDGQKPDSVIIFNCNPVRLEQERVTFQVSTESNELNMLNTEKCNDEAQSTCVIVKTESSAVATETEEFGSTCVTVAMDSSTGALRTEEPGYACVNVATDSSTGALRTEETGYACVNVATDSSTGALRTEEPGSACVNVKIESSNGVMETEGSDTLYSLADYLPATESKKHSKVGRESYPTPTGIAKHKCQTCGKRFHWEFELKTHLNSFVTNKEMKCKCDVTLACNGDLVEHLKRFHRYKLSFNCDMCGKLFTKYHDLQHHLGSHTGEKPYPCNHCDRSFGYRGDLNKHLRSHTGEKPFACKHCEMRFARNDSLVYHTYKHTGEMPFNCDDCGKGFVRKSGLTVHQKSALHNIIVYGGRNTKTTYHCDQCTETFKYRKLLNQHKHCHHSLKPSELQIDSENTATAASLSAETARLDIAHAGENTATAASLSAETARLDVAHAGENTATAASLSAETARLDVAHAGENTATAASLSAETARLDAAHADGKATTGSQAATIPREFHCKYCDEKFTDPTILTQHLREHTGKRHYFCKYCYKIFAHNFSLSQHINIHTGERPYGCKECNKSFKTKVQLVHHTTVHTGERKYKCKQCDKAFKRPLHLKRHLETHSGVKRFKCDHCNKAFVSRYRLNRHILTNNVENNLKCKHCDREFSSKHNLQVHVLRYHSNKESAVTIDTLDKQT